MSQLVNRISAEHLIYESKYRKWYVVFYHYLDITDVRSTDQLVYYVKMTQHQNAAQFNPAKEPLYPTHCHEELETVKPIAREYIHKFLHERKEDKYNYFRVFFTENKIAIRNYNLAVKLADMIQNTSIHTSQKEWTEKIEKILNEN